MNTSLKIIIAILMLAGVGCVREGPCINIIIDDNFIGEEFQIILDRKLGAEWKRQDDGYAIHIS